MLFSRSKSSWLSSSAPYLALIVFFSAYLGPASQASEVDNFTYRPTNSKDFEDYSATDAINAKTNELLLSSISELKDCNLEKLHKAIKDTLAGGEVGKLEYWAMQSPRVKKVVVPYEKSIYSETGLLTGSFGLFSMGITPSFILGGHYVGADKLGHFFDQGYDYYEAIYIKHREISDTVEATGLEDEEGVNGMGGNGIKSHADMAANFGGYLFWREVYGGKNPYFECKNGKIARTARSFDWAEYSSDAWDESINCSEFSPLVGKWVSNALFKLGASCPIDTKKCQEVADQKCGFSFMTPACLPYVKKPTVPDSACIKLIHVDESESQVCLYEPSLTRDPKVKTALDLVSGVGTVAKYRTGQAVDWAKRRKDQAYGQVKELWRSATH